MSRDLTRCVIPDPLASALLIGSLVLWVAVPAQAEEAVSDVSDAMSRICTLVAAEARELLVAEDLEGFETRLEVLEESGCGVSDRNVSDPDSWVPPILAESFPSATCFEFYRLADHAASHGLADDARAAMRGYERLGCAGQAPPAAAPVQEPAPSPTVATGGLGQQERAALVRRLNDRYCGYRNACHRADWSACMQTGIPGLGQEMMDLGDTCLRATVEHAVCMFEQGCAPNAAMCAPQAEDEARACMAEQERWATVRGRISAASAQAAGPPAQSWAQQQQTEPPKPDGAQPGSTAQADAMGATRHRDWLLDGGTIWGSYVDLDLAFLTSDILFGIGLGMEAGGSVNIFAPSRNSSGWAFLKIGAGFGFNVMAIEIDIGDFYDDYVMTNINIPLSLGAYAGGNLAAVGFRWVPTFQYSITEFDEDSSFNAGSFAFDLEFMSREQILTRATPTPGVRFSLFVLPPTSSDGPLFVLLGLGANWY